MTLLFEGLPEELPLMFSKLIQIRVKIEKWWVLNIDIATNSDFDNSSDIKESDIVTGSEMTNQIIFDMLSGDDKKATFYRDEFMKKYKQ